MSMKQMLLLEYFDEKDEQAGHNDIVEIIKQHK